MRLALSWLTVLPISGGTVNTRTARSAIACAPLVGALLGLTALGALAGLSLLGAPEPLAGLLVVGGVAVATRGMHIDGLADTADGLGCYGPPERALDVMRDGGIGPFGVTALIVTIGGQAACLSAVLHTGRWWVVPLALACGRAGITWCCRRGIPAARPEGLGALVAGTQPVWLPLGWTALLCAAALFAVPGTPWLGPLAVVLGTLLAAGFTRHATRRFGGITGDVLGAVTELTTTVVLVTTTLTM